MKKRLQRPWVLIAIAITLFIILVGLGLSGYLNVGQSASVIDLPHPSIYPPMNISTTAPDIPEPQLYTYIEVTNSCGPYYQGDCVLLRSGPGVEYPSVGRLRNGVVLKVGETVTNEGRDWYKIQFATALRYPERVKGDVYVAADMVQLFYDDGDHRLESAQVATTSKHIVVDASEQTLYAYDGDTLFMKVPISTGLEFTPTPRGTFTIFKMTPTRYMQGPLPGVGDQVYDLPGVPWDLYFTQDGAVIHGAYWHDHFGEPWSHGCINLSPELAKKLYQWASVGIKVTVRD